MRNAHERLKRAGLRSNVLNIDTRAAASNAYIRISGGTGLARELIRHASDDWSLSVHTNGHNIKSWLVALACGLAAQLGPGATLTLHSGFVPSYLESASALKRLLARMSCVLYSNVVCVNDEIAESITGLGIPRRQLNINPAFLPLDAPDIRLPENIGAWFERRRPVLSTVLFFRPEYGFDLLVNAVAKLRLRRPEIGCVVMGSGDETERARAAALVEREGLRDAIMLAGDVDHDLCCALMARSTVFVRATLQDGDSISVREAQSLGIPVVASNMGTRPEGTFLFEAGDVNELTAAVERALRKRSMNSHA